MNIIGHKIILEGQVVDTISNQKFKLPNTKIYSWSYHKQNIVALAIDNIIQLWTERKQNEWQMAISFQHHQQQIIFLNWAPYDVMFASIDQSGLTLIHNKKQDNWDQPIQLQSQYKTISFSQIKGIFAAGGNTLDFYENFQFKNRVNMQVDYLSYNFNDRLLVLSENSISIFDKNVLKQHIILNQIPNNIMWSISGTRILVQIQDEIQQYSENIYNEFVLLEQ